MERAIHERHKIGVEDAVLLDDCGDQQMFIDNLQKRLRSNLIYTYIGPVLISVNPYKSLPMYGSDHARLYKGVNYYEQPPHIFALANQALTSMVEENCDQCILISGESGAGKTEASKKILQYIGFACDPSDRVNKQRESDDIQRPLYQRCSFDSSVAVHNIRDRLVLSNPVLEAFGNARTVRNDNSSRFGKYMDVEFNFKGEPTGGHIRSYLLERSRVVSQATGECNFHIFHALLTGGQSTLLQRLCLQSRPDQYRYTRGGARDLTVDSSQFDNVMDAMKTVGFSDDDLSGVLQVVAGVLHMGNVSFNAESNTCHIGNMTPINNFAKVIGLKSECIVWALTHRTIEAQHDVVTTQLTADQACYARDALSKSVYSRLFDWLVARLNTCLAADSSSCSRQNAGGRSRLLGILDIYGFEVFATNSFEQFCINYCNEKLQQLFIELTLKSEQNEYMYEGIAWQTVDYFNNKVICDMIERRHTGIISLLDEECMRPGEATDSTFLEKMADSLGGHDHFVAHRTAGANDRKLISRHEFRIVHYAGGVTYGVTSFLDKNNDRLYRDLKHLMTGASSSIVQELFPVDEANDRRMPETVATQFRRSLDQLMTSLMSKSPSYIRCIKPNQHKRPIQFDSGLVSHQVQYLGLMENLRVRRAGFAYRRRFTDFLQRYKCLCPHTWPSPLAGRLTDNISHSVDTLMQYMGFDQRHFSLGRSKIFIRLPRTIFQVEDAFQLRKHDLATLISKTWRGYHRRKRFLLMRRSVTVISRHVRGKQARRLAERRRWAVGVIRSFIIGFMTRNSRVETSENRRFIGVMRREWLLRLSRHLPASILKLSKASCWPPAPPSCQLANQLLRPMYSRQMVRLYRSRLTEQRALALQLKVIAEDLFKGKKSGYQLSVAELFRSDRITDTVPASFSQKLLEAVARIDDSTVQYQSPVLKFDRHGYRCRHRHLVATDRAIHVLRSQRVGSLRSTLTRRSLHQPIHITDTFQLADSRLTVTADSDQLVILSCQLGVSNQPLIVNGNKHQLNQHQFTGKHSTAAKYKGDLILLPENVYELVTILYRVSAANLIVDFVPSNRVSHELSGGLRKHAEVQQTITSNHTPSVVLLPVSDEKRS